MKWGIWIGLGLMACSPKEQTGEMLPQVNVAHPIIREVTLQYSYPSTLQAELTVSLMARVSGLLERVAYAPGATVKSGALLFVIEPQPYADQLAVAKATLQSAEAQVAYAKSSYDKMSRAVENRAVSEINFIQARSNYEEALAQVENAKAQLNDAKLNLSYCYVRAPFMGRITYNLIDKGNYIQAPKPLATIYKENIMYAYFNMSYEEFAQLPTTKIEVQITDNQGLKISGVVDYRAPNVNQQTGSVMLRAVIKNNGALMNGMFVTVFVPYLQIDKAMLIPEASVGTNQAGRFVYVVNKEDQVEMRMVQVGDLMSDNMRIITSGLTVDDRYIVNGMVNARPGMKVKVMNK